MNLPISTFYARLHPFEYEERSIDVKLHLFCLLIAIFLEHLLLLDTIIRRRRHVISSLVMFILVNSMPNFSLGGSSTRLGSAGTSNSPSSTKHTTYGSLFLLAVGGTLLWVCHLVQYREIHRILSLYFAVLAGDLGERVYTAGSVPYIDSFVGIFAVGLVFVCLGFGGLIWNSQSSKLLAPIILFTVGTIMQIPQYMILHAVVSRSSSPHTALVAQFVGTSCGILGIVLVTLSLIKHCHPQSPLRFVSISSKIFFIIGNVLATVSLVLISATSDPKHGYRIYIVSYPLMAMSAIMGLFVYNRAISDQYVQFLR